MELAPPGRPNAGSRSAAAGAAAARVTPRPGVLEATTPVGRRCREEAPAGLEERRVRAPSQKQGGSNGSLK